MAQGLAPDVVVAAELITRVNPSSWGARTEGLTHSQPFLRHDDSEFFETLQAWLASRSGDRPSYVQAAVANLRRVLDDVLLVINYDMEPSGAAAFRVRKWYRRIGGDSDHLEVEHFTVHCLLIQNLAAELTRAVNLVIERARDADDRVLATVPLAIVDTGSLDAPMHAARYSDDEATAPQPYPGLRRFPAVIESRDIGALGEVHYDRPRTAEEMLAWIDELLRRREDSRSSVAPPTAPTDLSASLPRPEIDDPTPKDAPVWQHSVLIVAGAILLVVGNLNDATSSPRLFGFTVGALLVALPAHRLLLRPRPPSWAYRTPAAEWCPWSRHCRTNRRR